MSLLDVVTMKIVNFFLYVCLEQFLLQSKDCLFISNTDEDRHNCLVSRQN